MEQEERCLDEMESPYVDEAAALALARRLYGLEGGSATAMASYDDKNFWIKVRLPPARCARPPGF